MTIVSLLPWFFQWCIGSSWNDNNYQITDKNNIFSSEDTLHHYQDYWFLYCRWEMREDSMKNIENVMIYCDISVSAFLLRTFIRISTIMRDVICNDENITRWSFLTFTLLLSDTFIFICLVTRTYEFSRFSYSSSLASSLTLIYEMCYNGRGSLCRALRWRREE